ncbi:MAG: DUF3347 domain-containing protein [Opitutae bacterium]|nr:DUF3347 domain-containing protein [Opitutae bacterium]
MKFIHLLRALGFSALLASAAQAHDKNAPLDNDQKLFLAQYELVRAALAADDLAAARKAAAVVAAMPVIHHENGADAPPGYVLDARKLATTQSLQEAREVFKSFSKRAVHVAQGKPGYYVAHCPMVPEDKGDWVQTTRAISNPYLGRAMATCGSIEK